MNAQLVGQLPGRKSKLRASCRSKYLRNDKGSAVLAAAFPHVGIGLLGVSLAFGLTVLTMPFAIGLTLIHRISIPVTNTSANPARSTGVAIFEGGRAVSQLWLFWLAPIVGAVLAGTVYRRFSSDDPA